MLGIIDESHSSVVTGSELNRMSDETMKHTVMTCNVFACAVPQHKTRIVNALQTQARICSVTGDGVDDIPALEAADIGLATGGNDLVCGASEIRLVNNNVATLVTTIKEGRAVCDNICRVIFINAIISNAQVRASTGSDTYQPWVCSQILTPLIYFSCFSSFKFREYPSFLVLL